MDGWETLDSVVERDARASAVKGKHYPNPNPGAGMWEFTVCKLVSESASA